jgi:hypothetical protein
LAATDSVARLSKRDDRQNRKNEQRRMRLRLEVLNGEHDRHDGQQPKQRGVADVVE